MPCNLPVLLLSCESTVSVCKCLEMGDVISIHYVQIPKWVGWLGKISSVKLACMYTPESRPLLSPYSSSCMYHSLFIQVTKADSCLQIENDVVCHNGYFHKNFGNLSTEYDSYL